MLTNLELIKNSNTKDKRFIFKEVRNPVFKY